MRAGGASKTIKRKSGTPKKSPSTKLKAKANKFSQEFKAKNKERLQKWKVSIQYGVSIISRKCHGENGAKILYFFDCM